MEPTNSSHFPRSPYDLCSVVNNFSEEVCAQFPDPSDCSCPLREGVYDITGIKVTVPDFGEVLTPLMVGNYTAKAFIYSEADPADKLGCVEFEFGFKQATQE